MENKKNLSEKLQEVIVRNNGMLKIEDPALREEFEEYIQANPALTCKKGAELLGIREHQYYTARARLLGRIKKRVQREQIKFQEVKVIPETKPRFEEIKIITASGTRIETTSVEAALKILGAIKC